MPADSQFPLPPSRGSQKSPWWKRKWVLVVGGLLAVSGMASLASPAEDAEVRESSSAATFVEPTSTPAAPEATATAVPTPMPRPAPTATPRPAPTEAPRSEPDELSDDMLDQIAALAIRSTVRNADPLLGLVLDGQSDVQIVEFADSVCTVSLEANTQEELLVFLLIANDGAMEMEQVAAWAGASMGARCPGELGRLGFG